MMVLPAANSRHLSLTIETLNIQTCYLNSGINEFSYRLLTANPIPVFCLRPQDLDGVMPSMGPIGGRTQLK